MRKRIVTGLVGCVLAFGYAPAGTPSLNAAGNGPCDALSKADIQAAFGGTVADGQVDSIEKGQCKWEIAGGASGQAVVFAYPNSRTGFNTRLPGAERELRDQRTHLLPFRVPFVKDVTGIGDYAFVETDTRVLHVAKAPDLLFIMQYVAGASRFGQPITDAELNKLRQLASKFMTTR